MAADTFFDKVNGYWQQIRGTQVSTGIAEAGNIVALGDDGYLDPSLLPPGVGPNIKIITASEALAARDFVNIWESTGTKVRKADAATTMKHARGYVKASVLIANPAPVYFDGLNTGFAALTGGDVWLSATTPGAITQTPPTGLNVTSQIVGVAVSATEVNAEIQDPAFLVA